MILVNLLEKKCRSEGEYKYMIVKLMCPGSCKCSGVLFFFRIHVLLFVLLNSYVDPVYKDYGGNLINTLLHFKKLHISWSFSLMSICYNPSTLGWNLVVQHVDHIEKTLKFELFFRCFYKYPLFMNMNDKNTLWFTLGFLPSGTFF